MRVALVGPTHPFKGGVAAHTTQTAHRLAAAGHDVELVSWARLYPQRLYPGDPQVPGDAPEGPVFPRTSRDLRWDRPTTWWRTGRRLADVDLVVLVFVIPAQVPSLLTIAAAARRSARRRGTRPPTVVALTHNVVPHETHLGGRRLAERMLHRVDAVLVHSPEQARLAVEHGAERVAVADLPAHLPGGHPPIPAPERPPHRPGEPVRLLSLGIVRDYKGIDLLLEALRSVPEARLTVVGEQWGAAGERVRRLAAEPELAPRVELRPGYLPAADIPAVLAEHDVLVLAYRSATASQNVMLGHAYRMPVLATSVGTFPAQVRDGVDGLLVPPDDVPALTAAVRRLLGPGELDRLRAGVPAFDPDADWARYVTTLTGLAVIRPTEPSREEA